TRRASAATWPYVMRSPRKISAARFSKSPRSNVDRSNLSDICHPPVDSDVYFAQIETGGELVADFSGPLRSGLIYLSSSIRCTLVTRHKLSALSIVPHRNPSSDPFSRKLPPIRPHKTHRRAANRFAGRFGVPQPLRPRNPRPGQAERGQA